MNQKIKYPSYVPEWYDPEYSYYLMQKYGDHSKELKEYLENDTR